MTARSDFRILIIDDNPEIHKDFMKILTTNRQNEKLTSLDEALFGKADDSQVLLLPEFQIDTVSQGQEGVQYIEKALKEGNPYALAFVDIRMPPGWDGIETIKHIWALDRDVQVVICTAYSDYTWEETVEQLGTTDNLLVLKKPFDNVAVRQLACALTKKWQLSQNARQYTQFLEERVQERTDSLQQSLSLTRATLESSTNGMLVVDNAEKVVDYNNNFIQMWNIPQSILDTHDSKLVFEYVKNQLENPHEFAAKAKELENQPDAIEVDIVKLMDGKIYERYLQPHKLKEQTIGRVWSFRDITTRIHLEEKLEFQATHDALTGLPNRVLLMDRLGQNIATAKRNNFMIAILFFDLDRFKLINDSLTHTAGDKLLKMVSKRLQSLIREADTFARLGGDEFVVILPNIEKVEYISKVASKLLSAFNEPFHIFGRDITITASIGVCVYPHNGNKIDELLRNADLAMYKAKGEGGNQFQFYNQELNQQSLLRLEREAELRQAITNEEFFICYQPQFNLSSQELISTEALIRWQHPKHGVLLPIDFIPFAEETGLIVPIGEWVLRTACKQNKEWQNKGKKKISVAVNVATQQFKQPHFVENIQGILKETGLEAKYLEIELTENIIINNIEIIETINELKRFGIQIALDDFGTGNTSLSYLRKLPLDHLKIDKSYIKNIGLSRNDDVLIRAIISMANNLDLEVIAEGVENPSHVDFLKNQECNQAQGFYLSKPLLPDEFENLLGPVSN